MTPLGLYRRLLRYAGNLKFSDRNYVTKQIKIAFRSNQYLTDQKEIQFQMKRGQILLEKSRLV